MKLVPGSVLLAFLGCCLVGCAPSELTLRIQPDYQTLKDAYGAPFNLRVDIVAVQAGELNRYMTHDVTTWFRPGDPLRNPANVVALTFEPAKDGGYLEQTYSPTQYPDQWKQWTAIDAKNLVIYANIPMKSGGDANAAGDIRRFSLPLQTRAWKGARWPGEKNTVIVTIDAGGMRAVPPPSEK